MKRVILVLSVLIFAFGCSKSKEAPIEGGTAKGTPSIADNGAARMVGKTFAVNVPTQKFEYTWKLPQGWTESPATGMRRASFEAKAGDALGDVSLVELTGQGGGMVANVNRWREQLGLPALDEAAVNSEATADRGALGELKVFTIVNPKKAERAIMAAMARHGDVTIFVKLTASSAAIPLLETGFLEFARGLDVKAAPAQ